MANGRNSYVSVSPPKLPSPVSSKLLNAVSPPLRFASRASGAVRKAEVFHPSMPSTLKSMTLEMNLKLTVEIQN